MNDGLDQRPRSGWFRTAGLVVAAAVAAAWLLAACSAGPPTSHPSPTASLPRPPNAQAAPAWLLTRAVLSQLIADPAARVTLQASRVYEILQPGQQPLPGFAAEPVVTFASVAALEQAVVGGQLPAGTYGVLYDPEAWSFTPLAEQRDPVAAATRAAAVAHAHGLRLVVTPALDLTTVLAPGHGSRWQTFIALQLAGQLAKVADIVELQAQSLERDTATYAAFVKAAAAQADAARPGITVLAGLSTNPPGAAVDARYLTSAIQATRPVVVGYWLNVPGQGPRCPTCNASRPDIAAQILQQLG